MSIKYKVIISLIIFVLSILSTTAYIYIHFTEKNIKELSIEHLESLNHIVHDRVLEYVAQSEEKLMLFNSRVHLKEEMLNYEADHNAKSLKIIDKIIQKSKNSFLNVIDIIILDNYGKLIISMNKSDTLNDYSKKLMFKKASKKTYTHLQFEKESNTPFLCISGPLTMDNKFIGISILKIDLESLNNILTQREGLGESGEALLGTYGKNGDIILFSKLRFANTPLIIDKNNINKATPMREAINEKHIVIGDGFDYRRESVIFITNYFEQLKIGIVVKKDIKELMKPVNELKNLLLLIMMVIIFISIVLSLIISYYLTKQIINITQITSDISDGNLDKRVTSSSNDELGSLSKSVNKMADTLIHSNQILEERVKEKTHMLERANSKLQLIFDIAPNITIITNGKSLIKANHLFYEFTGYETLESFLEKYNCICDMFITRNGYLRKEYNDQSWVEYILNNPSTAHKAVIEKNGIENLFSVNAVCYCVDNEKNYIVVFENITQLQKVAYTDQLTSVSNRFKIDEVLVDYSEKNKRYRSKFSIIIIDIDNFKKVNDLFGHLVGDYVLKSIAELLRNYTRTIDIVGRWGGEEFMIIAKETDLNGASVLAENIRKNIEAYIFKNIPNQTASFGVAQFHEGDSVEDLIKHADDALYKAKEMGRNRVEIYKKNMNNNAKGLS